MKNLLLNSFLQKKMVFNKSVLFGATIFCLSAFLCVSVGCASKRVGIDDNLHYPDSIPTIHEPDNPTPANLPLKRQKSKTQKHSANNAM